MATCDRPGCDDPAKYRLETYYDDYDQEHSHQVVSYQCANHAGILVLEGNTDWKLLKDD